MSFKHLTIKSLPSVFVHTLALPGPEDLATIAEEINKHFADLVKTLYWNVAHGHEHKGVVKAEHLAAVFSDILNLPPEKRAAFCVKYDKILDDLLGQDFFGTEGQLDPRGDHRD